MALTPEERARAEEMAKIQAEAQSKAAHEQREQAGKFFKRIWLIGGGLILLIVVTCTMAVL